MLSAARGTMFPVADTGDIQGLEITVICCWQPDGQKQKKCEFEKGFH